MDNTHLGDTVRVLLINNNPMDETTTPATEEEVVATDAPVDTTAPVADEPAA